MRYYTHFAAGRYQKFLCFESRHCSFVLKSKQFEYTYVYNIFHKFVKFANFNVKFLLVYITGV
jgi:hypothetical protein